MWGSVEKRVAEPQARHFVAKRSRGGELWIRGRRVVGYFERHCLECPCPTRVRCDPLALLCLPCGIDDIFSACYGAMDVLSTGKGKAPKLVAIPLVAM